MFELSHPSVLRFKIEYSKWLVNIESIRYLVDLISFNNDEGRSTLNYVCDCKPGQFLDLVSQLSNGLVNAESIILWILDDVNKSNLSCDT